MFADYAHTTDANLAMRAFASAAAVFGAPIPAALLALANEGRSATTYEEVMNLLADANERADNEDATTIGILHDAEEWARGTNPPIMLSFGTGRSSAHLAIYADGPYWLWAQTTPGEKIRSPEELEHALDSLRRRWRAIRDLIPVPTQPAPWLEIPTFARARVEVGDEA